MGEDTETTRVGETSDGVGADEHGRAWRAFKSESEQNNHRNRV
jgi:hypothetical protein